MQKICIGIKSVHPVFWLGPDQPESNSGSPFYFLKALQSVMGSEEITRLHIVRYPRVREKLVSALRWGLAQGSDPRVFALSPEYLDRLLSVLPVPTPSVWISRSQMLPQQLLRADPTNVKIALYIDSTLPPLFRDYKDLRYMSAPTRQRWLERERDSYLRADKIFCYHAEVRRHLIEDYGVAPERTEVVGRGVNIPPQTIERPSETGRSHPFRLIFVGRDVKRKGLFELIAAIDSLPGSYRQQIELLVVGPGKSYVPRRPFLKWIGFLKSGQRAKLIELMRSADLGVLLSSAEGLPGFVWEMLYLGKPMLTTRLKQYEELPDAMPMIYVPLPLRVEDVAQAIKAIVDGNAVSAPAPVKLRKELSWERQAMVVANWVRQCCEPDQIYIGPPV